MAMIHQYKTHQYKTYGYYLYFISILLMITSIAIYIPYYFIDYKSSQSDKENLVKTTCDVLNQTVQYKYSCTKTFYQCGCNQMYYYPCDYLQSKYMEGYCCDPICYKNKSLNSLNFITCGYNIIFTTIIKNLENVTNIFVTECKFDDQSCQNYWINLKNNPFECFYDKSNPNQILLSKPDFLTLHSIGFIFSYVISGLGVIVCLIGIYVFTYKNDYQIIN